MKTTVYLHSSKEAMRDAGEKLGLSGEALEMFMFACYEVAVQLDVDPQTGIALIAGVDGHPLEKMK